MNVMKIDFKFVPPIMMPNGGNRLFSQRENVRVREAY